MVVTYTYQRYNLTYDNLKFMQIPITSIMLVILMISMIPDNVHKIIKVLSENDFKAYLIGGCVRDLLLKKTPSDWDVATDALPDQVIDLFHKTAPTGIKYGTVTVLGSVNVEVTTFRQESSYRNQRHPDEIEFSGSLETDTARRDFTVNGLAMDAKGEVQDHVGGLSDLKLRTIRAIGDPCERFSEDALRLMRAIRLTCQLNFSIESHTLNAIKRHAKLIRNIGKERIRDEFSKIVLCSRPSQSIRLMQQTGLLKHIMPELDRCAGFDQDNKYHDKDVFEHLLATIDLVPPKSTLRLASLMHDIGKPLTRVKGAKPGESSFHGHDKKSAEITQEILSRLRFDKNTVETVTILVQEHMSRFNEPGKKLKGVKQLINRVGKDNLNDLLMLQEADIKASAPPFDFSKLARLKKAVDKVLNEKQPLNVKDLAINGNDLIKWGMSTGPDLGNMLNNMVELVLTDPSLNTREDLQNFYLKQVHRK